MEKITIKDLSILVKRSARRKTVELSIERDGSIILYAPANADQDRLESMAKSKLVWIYRQLGRKEEELHRLPAKEFVSGEGFYYRGRKYRLKLLDEPKADMKGGCLRLQSGRFLMPIALACEGRDVFVEWYGKHAADWLPHRVEMLRGRVGVTPESVEIRDLGFRWGSCSRNGRLFFHWRLILLPIERIDYLILHELVHLCEHNHSPAFYTWLRQMAPDYEQQEEWLRRNGDRYTL
jgi:predicted metal-dependent hydrolase